jgi:hypothetical protein
MTVLTIQALGALLIGGVFVFAGIEHFLKFGAMRDYLAAEKFPAPALMLAAGSTVLRRRRAGRLHAGDELHAAAFLGERGAGAPGAAQCIPDQHCRHRRAAACRHSLIKTARSETKLCGNPKSLFRKPLFRDRLTAAKRIRTVRATDLERLS